MTRNIGLPVKESKKKIEENEKIIHLMDHYQYVVNYSRVL